MPNIISLMQKLSAIQQARLNTFLDLLLSANATMNLTRITDRALADVHHLADSLTLLPHLPAGPLRIADVGSGGGVPGIPLAIARDDAQVTLIESTKKKAAFLRATVTAMELNNVVVIDQRVESVAQSAQRESFDVVVVRAVAGMNFLAEWCLPLLKVGGKLLAMKGPKVVEELPAAQTAIRRGGGGQVVTHHVGLAELPNHVIVEIPKVRLSDPLLPRHPSVAKAKAL